MTHDAVCCQEQLEVSGIPVEASSASKYNGTYEPDGEVNGRTAFRNLGAHTRSMWWAEGRWAGDPGRWWMGFSWDKGEARGYVHSTGACLPAHKHTLMFIGEELSPVRTIEDYAIEDEAVLHLVESGTDLEIIKALAAQLEVTNNVHVLDT